MSLRGKTEDLFWFAFFHEASHVLHDHKKDLLINTGKQRQDDPREISANEYAAEVLLPKRYNDQIKAARDQADNALSDLTKDGKIRRVCRGR